MVSLSSLSRIEDYTATAVEDAFGARWGGRTVRDARDGSGLRVDLTYEDAGVALELTSLTDEKMTAASSEVVKLEARLTDRARREGWGGWLLGISMPSRIRDIEVAVTELMAGGEEFEPSYSSDALLEMAPTAARAFVRKHRVLHGLGLSMVRRWSDHDNVRVILSGGGFQITGFTEMLQQIVNRKAAVLEEARPRETHLAVLVARWDVSDFAAETRPPRLPYEIDTLWVVHPKRGAKPTRLWRLHRGEERWSTHSGRGIGATRTVSP